MVNKKTSSKAKKSHPSTKFVINIPPRVEDAPKIMTHHISQDHKVIRVLLDNEYEQEIEPLWSGSDSGSDYSPDDGVNLAYSEEELAADNLVEFAVDKMDHKRWAKAIELLKADASSQIDNDVITTVLQDWGLGDTDLDDPPGVNDENSNSEDDNNWGDDPEETSEKEQDIEISINEQAKQVQDLEERRQARVLVFEKVIPKLAKQTGIDAVYADADKKLVAVDNLVREHPNNSEDELDEFSGLDEVRGTKRSHDEIDPPSKERQTPNKKRRPGK